MSERSALNKGSQARQGALKPTTADQSPTTNNDLQQLALTPRKPALSQLFGIPEKSLVVPEKAVPFTTPRTGVTQTFEQLAARCATTRLVQFQRAFSPEPESRSSSNMLLPRGAGMMNPPAPPSRAFLNRATLGGCDFTPERLPPKLRQLHVEARVERAVEGVTTAPRSVQSLLELYRPLEESNPRVFVANVADKLNRAVSGEKTLQQLHGSVLIVDHPSSNTRPLRTVFIDKPQPPAGSSESSPVAAPRIPASSTELRTVAPQQRSSEAQEKHRPAVVAAELIAALRTVRELVSPRSTPVSQAECEKVQRTITPYARSSDTFLATASRLAASLLERSGRGERTQEARVSRLERLISLAERGVGRPPAPRSPSERDVALLSRVAKRDEEILSGFQKVVSNYRQHIERVVADAVKIQPTTQPLEKLPPLAVQAVQTIQRYAHHLGQVRLAPAARQAVALQRLSEQLTQAAPLQPVELPLISERLTRIEVILTLRKACNDLRKQAATSKTEPHHAASVLTSLLSQMQMLHTLHLTHFMAISTVRRPNAALRTLLKGNITELNRLLTEPGRLSSVSVDAFEELLDELTLLS